MTQDKGIPEACTSTKKKQPDQISKEIKDPETGVHHSIISLPIYTKQ